MKINLQNSVYSPQDLKAIILDVRSYARWAVQYSVKMRVTNSKNTDPPVISQNSTNLINEWVKSEPLNQKSLDELIAILENLEVSSPRISITLAAVPRASLKKVLVEWCRENIDSNILVDFHFNSTILGGMVVRHGSHVYDWSFRRQILAARDRFPEVLRSV